MTHRQRRPQTDFLQSILQPGYETQRYKKRLTTFMVECPFISARPRSTARDQATSNCQGQTTMLLCSQVVSTQRDNDCFRVEKASETLHNDYKTWGRNLSSVQWALSQSLSIWGHIGSIGRQVGTMFPGFYKFRTATWHITILPAASRQGEVQILTNHNESREYTFGPVPELL